MTLVELTVYGMELMGADTRLVEREIVDAIMLDPSSSADGETVAEWDGDTLRYPLGRQMAIAGRYVRTPITTQVAADELGVSRRRVQAMIRAGRLPATKYGRDWLISSADLDAVRDRKPGRPPASNC